MSLLTLLRTAQAPYVDLAADITIGVGLAGTPEVIDEYVDLAGDIEVGVGLAATATIDAYVDLAADIEVGVGLAGELQTFSPYVDLAADIGVSIGLSGRLGSALADTVWAWTSPDADPNVLRSLQVRIATKDGEFVTVDPKEIIDLEIVLTDRGGYDSMSLTLQRDARLQLGDLDALADVDVEYLGRTLFEGRIEEAGQSLSSTSMERPITCAGPLAQLKDHNAFRACYIDSDLSNWKTDQGVLGDRGIDVTLTGDHLRFATRYGFAYQGSNAARAYYELFDGIQDADAIVGFAARVRLMKGRYGTSGAQDNWSLCLYTRRALSEGTTRFLAEDHTNLTTVDGSAAWWLTDDIAYANQRLALLRMEYLGSDAIQFMTSAGNTGDTEDEEVTPSVCWRVTHARVVARTLPSTFSGDHDHGEFIVDPVEVVQDIVSPYWSEAETELFFPDESGITLTQCVFGSIPKTRADALEEVNELLGWDWFASRKTFTYRKPYTNSTVPDEALYRVPLATPGLTYNLAPAFSECYNAVRVVYTGKTGSAREVIVHADSETLGDHVRAETYQAPESIRTRSAAQTLGTRWLAAHAEPPVSGSMSLTGNVPVATGEDRDCLLMWPGEIVQLCDAPSPFSAGQKITKVTLRPLEHRADIEVGENSRRFDRWLARLSYGAKTRKR